MQLNTIIEKYSGTNFVSYTWDPFNPNNGWYSETNLVNYTYNPALYPTNGWSGATTLNPGEGAWLVNPTPGPLTVTFVGLVSNGQWTNTMVRGGNATLISSVTPQGGGIQSALGYSPTLFDEIVQWRNGQYLITLYDDTPVNGQEPVVFWWEPDDTTPAPEPVINVGESFFIVPAVDGSAPSSELWPQSYLDLGGDVPLISGAQATRSSFSFDAYGDAGTLWTVFSSTDLKSWTAAGSMTLNTNGLANFLDNTVGASSKFYKLGN
jgi:hypothetical protein